MIPDFSEGHFERSGIIHPNTQSHNSEKPNPQQPRCTNFSSLSECNIFFLTFRILNMTRIVQLNFQRSSSPRYELYLRRVKRSQYIEAATFTLISPKSFRKTCTELNIFAASYLNTQGLNNSCLKSPASTLVDLTFQSLALRSFSLNQLLNLSLQAGNLHSSFSISS